MKNLLRWLFGRFFLLTFVPLAVFALLVWWIGPLVKVGSIEPLVSEWARAGLIGAVVLLVLLRCLLRAWRARGANSKLLDGLAAKPTPAAAPAPPENAEQKVLAERFAAAIATLKKMRLVAAGRKPVWSDWLALSGGGYLYELPWYVFIGAPGAGKTTALLNSGLRFPLAEKFGAAAIRGVGGTRDCDWWFTDEAVLIDTAGRYTTQDSDAGADKSAWNSFLDLLKKTRPRRPINGVLLTVSIADLLGQSAAARADLAAALRARLLDIDNRLATRLPVYVLVTKSDLLSGFADYFGDLGKEQREQVFGFTLPLADSADIAERWQVMADAFGREFTLLRERLDAGLIARMQQEPDGARRAAIFGFPAQFGALAPLLSELLEQVFAGSRFTQPPWVRGVYFSSGTQEGRPIDRLMGGLARRFGIAQALAAPQPGSARSYFLATLLRQVVFAEQRLAGDDLKVEQRRHRLRLAALAAMALAAAVLAAAWGYSALRNVEYLEAVEARIAPMKKTLETLPALARGDNADGVSPGLLSMARVAPWLQALGGLWRAPENNDGEAPLSMTLGLYQGEKLEAAAALAQRRALDVILLPRLESRLDEQLRGAGKEDLEYAYEALKSYLMLHQAEHFDAEALKAWIALDWQRHLDRALAPGQRAALEEQLDALLRQGPPRGLPPMDENLVRSVRALLASYPLEQRIFSRLRRQSGSASLPPFDIAAAAGPAAALVFERASGKPLTQGVPGLFTHDGYRQRFQGEVVRLSALMAAEEPWVLGLERGAAARASDALGLPLLTDRVRRLYLEDYVRQWDQLLADVRLARTNDLGRSIEMARLVSGAGSPLAGYLRAVARETTLIEPNAGKDMLTQASQKVQSTRQDLQSLFGAAPAAGASASKPIESIVDDHFAPLRLFVGTAEGNQGAPLDDALKLFNEVYVYLNAVDAAVKSRSALPPGDAASKFKAEAGHLPEPVRSMIENLSQAGAVQARSAERDNLSQELTPVAEFCRRAIAGRYPLAASSPRDALPEDFGQFFGPGGMMDEFFQKRLAELVDTSVRPWRYKPLADRRGASAAALAQFERAARIREVFFRGGARTPALRFDFKPVEMDASITQFILDVDGQIVKYGHGPVVPMAVQWPGPKGSNQVRVQISPPSSSGASAGLTVDGPWALFRALEQSRLEPADAPERFFVTFTLDNRRARFEVTANSVQQPLGMRELREFSCPEGL